MMQDYEIINSDCIKAMQEMPDGCVDAIVTDPPYGLSFMNKEWDSFGTDTRQPGDEHYWVPDNPYGRSKARYGWNQDKSKLAMSNRAFQESMTPIFAEALRVAKPGAHLLCFGGTRTFHRMTCAIEDAGWEIRDCIMWVTGQGFPKSMDVSKAIEKKHGADAAAQWEGWGTCLKPAWEPIIVARKPLDGTVASNVLKWGVGAMNIDGCRVPTGDKLGGGVKAGSAQDGWRRPFMDDPDKQAAFAERKKANVAKSEQLGRFPANLVHDGSQMVLDLFPNTGKADGHKIRRNANHDNVYGGYTGEQPSGLMHIDNGGSAARFFYCAKASKKDRGEGNDHPTVKPNALMRWLVRLVCPQGGTVLDPFMGSGSTGVACIQEGMRFFGIDMDEHYCEIAENRIGAAQ